MTTPLEKLMAADTRIGEELEKVLADLPGIDARLKKLEAPPSHPATFRAVGKGDDDGAGSLSKSAWLADALAKFKAQRTRTSE